MADIDSFPTDMPSRLQPTTFSEFMDATLGHFPTFIAQTNAKGAEVSADADDASEAADAAEIAMAAAQAAAIGALAATTYVGTSTSSFAATTGNKTVHTAQAGRGFAVNDRMVLIDRQDPTVRIAGAVTISDGSDDYTVSIDAAPGLTGPYANWIVMLEALEPIYWSTAAMIWAATEARAAVSPKSLKDANAYVALTYASTLNINLANGFARSVVLTGSPTIAAPTGMFDRCPLTLKFEKGSGGGSPSWNSAFDFGADGVPTFAGATGTIHYVDCEYDLARTKWRATYAPPA